MSVDLILGLRRPGGAAPLEPLYFASGTTSPSRLDAALEGGQAVGLAIQDCARPCQKWLEKNLGDPRLKLFVDSGAYAEHQAVRAGRPALTDGELRRRYETMARIAEGKGDSAVAIVLPDRIGDTAESLRRLGLLKKWVRRIVAAADAALLPLQKSGRRFDPRHYIAAAARATGAKASDLVPTIPVVSRLFSVDEIVNVVETLRPPHIHLLGIAPSEAGKEIVPAIQRVDPAIKISLDSVMVRGRTGFTGGPLQGPRGQTAVRYATPLEIDPQTIVRKTLGGEPDLDALVDILSYRLRAPSHERAAQRLASLREGMTDDPSWFPDSISDLDKGGRPYVESAWVFLKTGLHTEDWDYWVDQVGRLLLAEDLGRRGGTVGRLSGEASKRGFHTAIAGSPPVHGRINDLWTIYGRWLPPGSDKDVVEQMLRDIKRAVPSLGLFGALQIAEAAQIWRTVNRPHPDADIGPELRRAWVGLVNEGRRFGYYRPAALSAYLAAYAREVEKLYAGWTWSSRTWLASHPDLTHPANDPRWAVAQSRRW